MTDDTVLRFFQTSERGMNWIAAQQRSDGSFCNREDGVGGYYKVPYALALTGRQREAQRLMNWIAAHHFTAEGDFRAPERKAHEPTHDAWPAYANAWLVQGAHRLGRWDLSQRGTDFLLRYQSATGGFFALDEETRYLEPVNTSWGGLAALTTGHWEAACRAGDLLARLVEEQPRLDRFYFRMDVEGNLITNVPTGLELFYYVDATAPKQIYYHPGIALIFLTHLYRATNDMRYLNACQTIFRFTEQCADDIYRFPPSGKLGLGCAQLYALTGNEQARRAAIRLGNYLTDTQTKEGFWILPNEGPYTALKKRDGYEIQLDLTAEFSTFLVEIASWI
ncbi:hypothetical protein KFU94_46695 [Chloroflexi bacterium TSY]|nr:hypothetical protein [Chloroflexi bacterium TSY]